MCDLEYDGNQNTTGDDYFVSGTCPDCFKKCQQCLLCPKQCFSSRYHEYRTIRYHISTKHGDINNDGSAIDLHDTDVPYDCDNEQQDSDEIDGVLEFNVDDVELDDDPTIMELNFDNDFTFHQPASGDVIIELDQFHVFSNQESNVYFWQE